MNLTYQIIEGARNFDRVDQKVGDIRPAKILLNELKLSIIVSTSRTNNNRSLAPIANAHNSQHAHLMPTPTSADGRSTTQPGRPSPETSKNLAHFSKAVLAPRWRLFKSGRFFLKFGVSETWSIQHPKFNSSKLRHF